MTTLDSDYYDRWYSDVIRSSSRDAIVQRALALPPTFRSTGLVGWDALGEVVGTLGLQPGHTLLDLACGRGGYGLEIIRRTGARLVGVDFSRVAVEHARRDADAAGLADRCEFLVNDLADTGVAASSVDALICLDSIQFAEPLDGALRECHRVLKPGGRVAVTGWRLVDASDEHLRRRVRHRELAAAFRSAGFERVEVTDRPSWRIGERAMWSAALTVEGADDPALREMCAEARRALKVFDLRQRILLTAVAPAPTAAGRSDGL
ncbi:hypothetical protein Val02_11170 [Virgisporangium aliadipatigenens]|uniref:Methyltransferase type 11 domain-containing protein n=1 Tax=Virgisporangium aliadipatigenens TaxID=741659 RepID=A0A8J4DNW2_9ACTN|nr:class I SAM-dependent methyltransferase [Virgisporangium aliadipatigenens]GIJ44231.1 hypothetical protein Val02_11170 [Virgisporangium aliadipatigenens]